MEYKILCLLLMIFLHIVDDYYLQGVLANMKQSRWWRENASHVLYRNDWVAALLMHGFSWSFMVMLPAVAYVIWLGLDIASVIVVLLINMVLHCIVDDMKANRYELNLVQDQLIHLGQIFTTWVFVFFVMGGRM